MGKKGPKNACKTWCTKKVLKKRICCKHNYEAAKKNAYSYLGQLSACTYFRKEGCLCLGLCNDIGQKFIDRQWMC